MIAERLKQGYVREPHVTVTIEAYRPFFILGEVTTPGQYPYVPNMTVENAIAIAGGFAPRANKQHGRAHPQRATASSSRATCRSIIRCAPATPSWSRSGGSNYPPVVPAKARTQPTAVWSRLRDSADAAHFICLARNSCVRLQARSAASLL